jgi:hypothetical protein
VVDDTESFAVGLHALGRPGHLLRRISIDLEHLRSAHKLRQLIVAEIGNIPESPSDKSSETWAKKPKRNKAHNNDEVRNVLLRQISLLFQKLFESKNKLTRNIKNV